MKYLVLETILDSQNILGVKIVVQQFLDATCTNSLMKLNIGFSEEKSLRLRCA
jgi:hypothetical protein